MNGKGEESLTDFNRKYQCPKSPTWAAARKSQDRKKGKGKRKRSKGKPETTH
jgi:hypothetical protein